MAPAKPATSRKRTRKRKRRAVSSSDSSSSDESSSDSEAPNQAVVRVPIRANKKTELEPSESSSSDSSSSDSSSSDSSSSDSSIEDDSDLNPAREPSPKGVSEAAPQKPARRSLSPTPPPSSIPPFLPPSGNSAEEKDEQVLKERFRKFWMASVADAFKDDLEELRKEPNMTKSRLAMLIDSLAAGGDVLTSARVGPDSSMTEMEIVLENNK